MHDLGKNYLTFWKWKKVYFKGIIKVVTNFCYSFLIYKICDFDVYYDGR
jgi:hypothetical protein